MRRPWHTYLLLFVGILFLLGALFRPAVPLATVPPGGAVRGARQRLEIEPGTPLHRAGVRTGDLLVRAEAIELSPGAPRRDASRADAKRLLRWTQPLPRAARIEVRRGSETLRFEIRPPVPRLWIRLAWGITWCLNVGLAALALALFWQRPRDGSALLLGLVLMFAPVFALPQEPRLFTLALAAHFFAVFPRVRPQPERPPPGGWRTAAKIYAPFLFFSLVGSGMWEDGRVDEARGLFHAVAAGYAAYGLARVLARRREVEAADRPVMGTLTVAASAILAAVLVGASQQFWVVSNQIVPANLAPAVLFSGAVARLVFRLRALEVRVVARRTLQYLLARWTLGTLFLIPGFLLVFRLGQLSALEQSIRQGEVLPYLVWMFLTALLIGKRQEVLRNLERRFFRDAEAARQALIRLAHEVGEQTRAEAVVETLEQGIRRALRPGFVRLQPPDAALEKAAELVAPVRHGQAVLGHLLLSAKESGEPYTTEERQLVAAAALQAGTALENARLSAALLTRQRAELAARTAGVLAGAEEERRRLAADLHDQVLPELRQIAAEVEALQPRANGLAPDLARLERDVRGTMDSVREVMEALRPSTLDLLGLGDAVESYLRKCAARCAPPVAVSVRREGGEPSLTAEQSLALYRICQEAINNLLKHSGAARAGLEIRSAGGMLTLALSDDGCGFDPETAAGRGHGLANMRYRADLIGAAVAWTPNAPQGTCVEVRLPARCE